MCIRDRPQTSRPRRDPGPTAATATRRQPQEPDPEAGDRPERQEAARAHPRCQLRRLRQAALLDRQPATEPDQVLDQPGLARGAEAAGVSTAAA